MIGKPMSGKPMSGKPMSGEAREWVFCKGLRERGTTAAREVEL